MTHGMHKTGWMAAATILAGCVTGGSGAGDKIGPTVSAPTMNQAPSRETPMIATTPASDPATTATRHTPPPDTSLKPENDLGWEYRLYNYLPVNASGQNELGLLLARLIPDGWELYRLGTKPGGYNTALFRRWKVQAISPTAGLPPAPGTSGTSGDRPAGSPSSIPSAPGR
jgi:hypothetical protein